MERRTTRSSWDGADARLVLDTSKRMHGGLSWAASSRRWISAESCTWLSPRPGDLAARIPVLSGRIDPLLSRSAVQRLRAPGTDHGRRAMLRVSSDGHWLCSAECGHWLDERANRSDNCAVGMVLLSSGSGGSAGPIQPLPSRRDTSSGTVRCDGRRFYGFDGVGLADIVVRPAGVAGIEGRSSANSIHSIATTTPAQAVILIAEPV